jgi:hypothetical protein
LVPAFNGGDDFVGIGGPGEGLWLVVVLNEETVDGGLKEAAMKRICSHIDMDERRKIGRWRMAGLGVGIIAEQFGRHRSTILRDINRNMFVI